MTLNALVKRIDDLREAKGITREKLAFYSELPKSNITELLQGTRDPRYTTLEKIAKGLDISLSELLKF